MAQPALALGTDPSPDDATADREQFGVFYADEAVQAIGTELAQQRGWSTTNIRKGGLATALRLLGVMPPNFPPLRVSALVKVNP